MIELLVNSFWDAGKMLHRMITKNDSKLEKESLDKLFISIGLENQRNNLKPQYIATLEDTEKILKIVLDNSEAMFNLDQYQAKEESFINYFNCKKVNFEYDYNRNIIVSLYKELMKESYPYSYKKSESILDIFLGYDIFENEIFASIDKHMMIGGATGQGKSSFLNSFILNTLYNNKNTCKSKPIVELILIDLKGVEFNVYENINNVNVYQDVEKSIKALSFIKEEIEKRKKIFKRLNVKNLEEYNQVADKKLNYVFIVIDEFACFQELISDKNQKEQVLSDLKMISSICRSFGLKLIVASQKTGVSAGSMDSFFRSQISSSLILGFKVQDDNTSKTIIFKDGLEKLTREGEALAIVKGKEKHIQTMFLGEKELKSRLKKDIK